MARLLLRISCGIITGLYLIWYMVGLFSFWATGTACLWYNGKHLPLVLIFGFFLAVAFFPSFVFCVDPTIFDETSEDDCEGY